MSVLSLPVSSQPNTMIRRESGPLAFEKRSTSSFASNIPSVASSEDRGYRQPPSSTVWNCDLHDRFM